MFWRRHKRDKPFKANPKYLATIKYYNLKPFQPVLKSETLTVRAVIGAYQSLFRKKINCVILLVTYHVHLQIS